MIRQICNVRLQDIVTTRSNELLCGLALRIWTSFWRREDSDGMDMWNAPMVQSRQPLTYRLMESVGLGGPKWHGSSWQREIAESGSSWLSILMIDVPGDLVWDLPCMQQASYLEGGPLMWMLPLYLHVNQKSDYDMMNIACTLQNKLCYAHKSLTIFLQRGISQKKWHNLDQKKKTGQLLSWGIHIWNFKNLACRVKKL